MPTVKKHKTRRRKKNKISRLSGGGLFGRRKNKSPEKFMIPSPHRRRRPTQKKSHWLRRRPSKTRPSVVRTTSLSKTRRKTSPSLTALRVGTVSPLNKNQRDNIEAARIKNEQLRIFKDSLKEIVMRTFTRNLKKSDSRIQALKDDGMVNNDATIKYNEYKDQLRQIETRILTIIDSVRETFIDTSIFERAMNVAIIQTINVIEMVIKENPNIETLQEYKQKLLDKINKTETNYIRFDSYNDHTIFTDLLIQCLQQFKAISFGRQKPTKSAAKICGRVP